MRDVTRFHLFVRRRRLRRPPQESRTAAVDRDEEGQAIIEIVARVGTPAEKGTGHSKLVRHYDSEASWNNLLPHDEAIFGYVIEARETKSSSHLLHKAEEMGRFFGNTIISRLRDMMKTVGLKKEKGCSWIEIKNKNDIARVVKKKSSMCPYPRLVFAHEEDEKELLEIKKMYVCILTCVGGGGKGGPVGRGELCRWERECHVTA
ncbi:Os05g0369800 [Oryza sativa Japonica Group]|uniref:Os05g0369800 protein n=1 Tax=Oryza sativa subsp. japonica TaxID=39947 RepID=C7J329_ORYSJ|nr:Os05g0369800 [Oryza sativa Japonica Group]|eukprot:NP_001174389.1 Os05g0369800 [Oryza sativa Japonica Group]